MHKLYILYAVLICHLQTFYDYDARSNPNAFFICDLQICDAFFSISSPFSLCVYCVYTCVYGKVGRESGREKDSNGVNDTF